MSSKSKFRRDIPNIAGRSFDAWMRLARENPQGFEKVRAEILRAEIEKASEAMRPRLRSMQWRIEREREKTADPLASAGKIYGMMWERVFGAGGLLQALDALAGKRSPDTLLSPAEKKNNVIRINFRK